MPLYIYSGFGSFAVACIVVQLNEHGTERGTRLMILGLSLELRPFRLETRHLMEEVCCSVLMFFV